MALVTLGYNAPNGFVSGETVTPAKLNSLGQPTVSAIVNADIDNNAAIALSKLAAGALPTAITVASANIVDGTIVNSDINDSASIALSKLAAGALPAGITVASANIVDGTITSTDLTSAVANALVPVGAVMPFAMNSAPSGWLVANGDAVSRSTYATLFAAIGTTHGVGDGSTTFNLPDLRGIFVRGSGTQTISGTAYSGTFAAKQQDDLKSHTHKTGGNIAGASLAAGSALSTLPGFNTPQFTEATGGTETRPANIALLYCIKF